MGQGESNNSTPITCCSKPYPCSVPSVPAPQSLGPPTLLPPASPPPLTPALLCSGRLRPCSSLGYRAQPQLGLVAVAVGMAALAPAPWVGARFGATEPASTSLHISYSDPRQGALSPPPPPQCKMEETTSLFEVNTVP